ncbi:MAG: hypothetical protein WD045_12565, partial [Pirellulaceae bacterium]
PVQACSPKSNAKPNSGQAFVVSSEAKQEIETRGERVSPASRESMSDVITERAANLIVVDSKEETASANVFADAGGGEAVAK